MDEDGLDEPSETIQHCWEKQVFISHSIIHGHSQQPAFLTAASSQHSSVMNNDVTLYKLRPCLLPRPVQDGVATVTRAVRAVEIISWQVFITTDPIHATMTSVT